MAGLLALSSAGAPSQGRLSPNGIVHPPLPDITGSEGVEKLQKAIDELQNAAEPDQISIDEVTDPAKE